MKLIAVISVLLAALIAGCGIFDTRNPEEPGVTRSTYVPPTSPDAVLSNLTFSVIEKNINNYQKSLAAKDFVFIPDSKSALIYGHIFIDWSIEDEVNYIHNVFSQMSPASSSNLFLSNKQIRQISTDSAIVNADYIVVFQHDKPNLHKSAHGNFRLTMTADELNNFYIQLWEDFRKNDTDFTWSELKANFSN